MPSARDTADQIATLRIELLDTEPVIWRELEVPTSLTLADLHDVIQAAMPWDDQHLWELRRGKQRYGNPASDDGWGGVAPTIRADKVRLREILKPSKTILNYTYDFGDSWEHQLTFTDLRKPDPGQSYPRYVAGENAAPPEDCGGVPGFYDTLDALADPEHPDHAQTLERFEGYDSEVIDQQRLAGALARIANRRPPAR